MNVDDAMEAARQFGEQKPEDMLFAEHIAILLAAEVERLRAEVEILAVEVTRLQAIEHEQIETQAELAAAKAASVCPEESVIWLLAVAAKLEKDGESSRLDSMTKTAIWLRERMKDKSPPEA